MNRGNKSASWNDKLDLESNDIIYNWADTPKEWFKLKHSPFSKEIHRIMIGYWLYSVTLQTQQFLFPSNS